MEDEGVYTLEEPENSLSPEMHTNCLNLSSIWLVIIIRRLSWRRTHPFYWGGVRSKIYNLDERPVRVRKFEELESVRFYHDILCERLNAKN